MKRIIMVAVVAVICGGQAYAQNADLEAVSAESSIAASSGDLGSARELSARQLDGSSLRSDNEAVRLGELAPVRSQALKLSEPRKQTLRADVPAPARASDTIKKSDAALFGMGALIALSGLSVMLGIPAIFMIGLVGVAALAGLALLGVKRLITAIAAAI